MVPLFGPPHWCPLPVTYISPLTGGGQFSPSTWSSAEGGGSWLGLQRHGVVVLVPSRPPYSPTFREGAVQMLLVVSPKLGDVCYTA